MGPVALVKTLWAGKKLQDAWKKAIWRKSLMGWKTVLGAVLLGVGTTLSALEDAGVLVGGKAIAAGLQGVGGALGLYGLRSAIANGGAKLPIAILGLWLALGSFATQGMAQDFTCPPGSAYEPDTLACTQLIGPISAVAADELAREPQDARRKAQIEEAKGLLREKARIEKRLAELDNDAEPLSHSGTLTTDYFQGWANDGCLTIQTGGTNEIRHDSIWPEHTTTELR